MTNGTVPLGWQRFLGWLNPKWRKARDVEGLAAWENEGGAPASPGNARGRAGPVRSIDAPN